MKSSLSVVALAGVLSSSPFLIACGTGPKAVPEATVPKPALAEKKVRVVFDGKSERRAAALRISLPDDWSVADFHGDVVDGRDGIYTAMAPGEGDHRPGVTVTAGRCDRDCTLADFDAHWPTIQGGAGKGMTVIKRELVRTGVGVAVSQGMNAQEAIVDMRLVEGSPVIVQCIVYVPDLAPEPFQSLVTACKELVVEGVDDLIGGERLVAETAKLEQCPKATALTYKNVDKRKGAPKPFGKAKQLEATALAGQVQIFIANSDKVTPQLEGAFGGEEDPKAKRDPSLGLSLRLIAPQGDEVASGSFGGGAKGGVQIDARLHGVEGSGMSIAWPASAMKVEVIARTHDRVCGTIAFENEHDALSGTFDLPLAGAK